MDKKKILIVLPNWIGDVVMSLPFLNKSRDIFPDSEIYILINEHIFSLIEYPCHNLRINPIFYKDKKIGTTLEVIKTIRAHLFDKGFILPRSYRMFFTLLLGGVKNIYGYADSFKKLFFKKYLNRDNNSLKQHRVKYYLNILKLYRNFQEEPPPYLELSESQINWANYFIQENSLSNKIIIGLNPGATYGEAKCWGRENYLKLIKSLSKSIPEVTFIIIGGRDNVSYNQIFSEIPNVINLTGKLSLQNSSSIMSKFKIFITNDTGPMHIADALQINIVAIFGPTDPKETPPYTMNQNIIYKKLPCSPCKKRLCQYGHNNCMKSISVEEIKDIVKKLLGV